MVRTATARRPWAAVIGLSLDQVVAWGALYYAYSVLSVPMARDLAVPTTTVAAAFSGSLLISSMLATRVGRLLDRRGARPVLVYGGLIAPLALGGLALVDGVPRLLFMFAALGVAQALSLYEPAFRAIVDWFPDTQARSHALLVLTAIGGFASTVFLPLTAVLHDWIGWRPTVVILATLTAVVTIPIRLSLPRRAAPSSPAVRAKPHTPIDGSPNTTRLLLSGGFALQSFAATGAMLCLVWQFVERGETLAAAASLAGLAGGAQVPGRLLLSCVSNIVATEVRLPLLFVLQGVALAAVALLSGPVLILAVVTFGATAGVMTLERAAVVLEWFGRDAFSTASGQLATATLFARAAAPFAVEVMHGNLNYATVLQILSLGVLIGGVVVGLAIRSRRRWLGSLA
jgi:MFS family permease